jgi:hypothetical protein
MEDKKIGFVRNPWMEDKKLGPFTKACDGCSARDFIDTNQHYKFEEACMKCDNRPPILIPHKEYENVFVPWHYYNYEDYSGSCEENENEFLPVVSFNVEEHMWELSFSSADESGYGVARFSYFANLKETLIALIVKE